MPIVLGQTQEAIDEKSGASSAKPRRLWDEARFLETFAGHADPKVRTTANAIVAWIKARADRAVFNDAPSFGSIGPEFKTGDEACVPMRLWTDGSLPVCFNQLKRTSVFAADSARQELMDRLNTIPGVMIPPDALEKQPYIRLAAVSADHGASFLEIMDWVCGKLREASPV